MGKKARTRRAEQRKKDKRSRKAQQKALYESYKASGQNKKSKRVTLGTKRARTVRVKRHAQSTCGNVGCSKCRPEYNTAAFAVSEDSFLYKRKFMSAAK